MLLLLLFGVEAIGIDCCCCYFCLELKLLLLLGVEYIGIQKVADTCRKNLGKLAEAEVHFSNASENVTHFFIQPLLNLAWLYVFLG